MGCCGGLKVFVSFVDCFPKPSSHYRSARVWIYGDVL
jgi:hypothetical protein